MVGGYQHHVAGVVVTPVADRRGTAIRAWDRDSAPPIGNRVVERLQSLE
jgi:hypothetical protein